MNHAHKNLIQLTILTMVIVSRSYGDGRPNIIFIMVDDLGKEWVSCYGAADIETPNIDALAAGGMRFENVYCMPQCTPTRVCLLTGQYPYRNGWVNHWDVPRWGAGCHFDPAKYPAVLGRVLRDAGYATAAAGKWQIDDFRVEPDAMREAGFDHWCMWTGYEGGNPPSGKRYQDAYVYQSDGSGKSRSRKGRFGPDVYSQFLLAFIEQQRDKPFFVYYPMVLTHGPLVATPDEPQATGKLGRHKAMVRYTDTLLGKLTTHLDMLKIRERTIIVWTTDNGTSKGITGHVGGRPVRGGKSETTENGINVPFIVNGPGHVPAGRVTDALVDFTDLLATFADLAGTSVPDGAVDGRSFAELLLGRAADSPRTWMMAMGGQNKAQVSDHGVENQWYFRDRVIRDKRYKLFIGTDRQVARFIDLKTDVDEQMDLIGTESSEALAARKRLEHVIAGLPSRDADPRYKPNPKQAWDRQPTVESQVWKSGQLVENGEKAAGPKLDAL